MLFNLLPWSWCEHYDVCSSYSRHLRGESVSSSHLLLSLIKIVWTYPQPCPCISIAICITCKHHNGVWRWRIDELTCSLGLLPDNLRVKFLSSHDPDQTWTNGWISFCPFLTMRVVIRTSVQSVNAASYGTCIDLWFGLVCARHRITQFCNSCYAEYLHIIIIYRQLTNKTLLLIYQWLLQYGCICAALKAACLN